MTLVKKGTFTSPGSLGAQAITGVGFVPQALIVFTASQATDGATHGNAIFATGCATRDGGATQQWSLNYGVTDAVTSTDTAPAFVTTALLEGPVVPGFTVDFSVQLTSFDAVGGFTVNWSDLPATSSLVIHYVALGGMAAARAGSFNTATAVATQDVTINGGWGQPEVLMFGAATGSTTSIAWTSASSQRSLMHEEIWGSATTQVVEQHAAQAFTTCTGNGSSLALDSQATLATSGWLADSFRVSYSDQAGLVQAVGYLALQGVGPFTIGTAGAPTAVAPQTTDLALLIGAPTGAIIVGSPIPTDATQDSTNADLGGIFMGATDGTNEGCAGATTDDAAATSNTGRFSTTTKAFQFYTAPAVNTNPPTLASETDSSLVGLNVRLTWNDTDTVVRRFFYIVFGSAVLSAPVPSRMPLGV
jgi:hypothetical protein